MKHKFSFFEDEQDLINAILEIHNNGNDIDCDPMYNKGVFYKDNKVHKPKYRYDINASINDYDAIDGDATNLPLDNNSIKCIILDPPFMFGRYGKNSITKNGKHGKASNNASTKRYTMFNTYNDLESCYKGILKEAYRILDKKGICIFKCQDYTDEKTTMTHCLIYQWAIEQGFYAKDIAILNSNHPKIYNGNTKQRHLRKTHCYFWVFEKKRRNTNV